MKINNNLFLGLILCSLTLHIQTENQQNLFDSSANVAVKRFVISRAETIKKEQDKVEEKKSFMQKNA